MSKNNLIATRVLFMILGVLIGVALVIVGSIVEVGTLVWLALVVWGVIVIIGNIPGLIFAIANIKAKGAIFDLIMSILGILLGVGLIVSQSKVITILLAAYMIVFPIIRIILAKSNWSEQLKREALRLILGTLLLVFGGTVMGAAATVLNTVLWVIGAVIAGLSV
ncbi:MAG: hypothetical protein IKU90_05925, partial [Clostridia bacterium]|nr:hypothetical protein [Clostridia bacterium]